MAEWASHLTIEKKTGKGLVEVVSFKEENLSLVLTAQKGCDKMALFPLLHGSMLSD